MANYITEQVAHVSPSKTILRKFPNKIDNFSFKILPYGQLVDIFKFGIWAIWSEIFRNVWSYFAP